MIRPRPIQPCSEKRDAVTHSLPSVDEHGIHLTNTTAVQCKLCPVATCVRIVSLTVHEPPCPPASTRRILVL